MPNQPHRFAPKRRPRGTIDRDVMHKSARRNFLEQLRIHVTRLKSMRFRSAQFDLHSII
jgi:hypothetical protein